MKPRKLMVTIEMLTDIPSREFSKFNVQAAFYEIFRNDDEALEVHQVRTQVVKEDK